MRLGLTDIRRPFCGLLVFRVSRLLVCQVAGLPADWLSPARLHHQAQTRRRYGHPSCRAGKPRAGGQRPVRPCRPSRLSLHRLGGHARADKRGIQDNHGLLVCSLAKVQRDQDGGVFDLLGNAGRVHSADVPPALPRRLAHSIAAPWGSRSGSSTRCPWAQASVAKWTASRLRQPVNPPLQSKAATAGRSLR